MKSKILDKYYTKKAIAQICLSILEEYCNKIGLKEYTYLEPSAGNGSFSELLPSSSISIDISPEKDNIFKADFLSAEIDHLIRDKKLAIIGNPPFGRKSKLAIEFTNKSLNISEIVGFIVPVQFKKWSVQSKIEKDAVLVFEEDLPINSFLFENKDFKIRTCFQIWTKNKSLENIRIKSKPKTVHKDFEIYQYNRTKVAEKYFELDWDFAVPRQGYYDYSKKFFKKEELDKKIQWIFFKAKNKRVLDDLMELDFVKLSEKNSGIPGFGKADVIEEYERLNKD